MVLGKQERFNECSLMSMAEGKKIHTPVSSRCSWGIFGESVTVLCIGEKQDTYNNSRHSPLGGWGKNHSAPGWETASQ